VTGALIILLSLSSGIVSGETILDRGVRMEWHGVTDSVTFIGHSSFLIDLGGTRVLTDPNYSERIGFSKRISNPGVCLKCLPEIDLILISHGHYDHMDEQTLSAFRKDIPVILPHGLRQVAMDLGFTDVREMRPWESAEIKGMKINCVPAKHFPGRSPLNGRTGYQGYVLEKGKSVFFAGDTAYFDGFKEIGRRFKVDVALLPIGAYRPWFFRFNHMSPIDALDAFADLGARTLIPIHFGTFKLSLEKVSEPPLLLMTEAERRGISNRVVVLRPGDYFEIR